MKKSNKQKLEEVKALYGLMLRRQVKATATKRRNVEKRMNKLQAQA